MEQKSQVKSFIVKEELHRRVKMLASQEGKDIQEVVETFLNAQLEQHPNGGVYAGETIPNQARTERQSND